MEEKQLIEGCIRGDKTARKKLYELHAPAMMSVCLRYVRCRETARDVLQDGFVKLFTKIHTYAGTGAFNGWVRRIFVTTALEHLRKNRKFEHHVEISGNMKATDDISVIEQFSADELLECVANLPEIYRTVFNLHAIEGYTHVEIAEELQISDSTVRARYARARELLQKVVNSY